LSAQVSRSGRACAPRWWAVVLLLIAALPFASIHTGATGPIMTATTVATLIADINVANTNPMQGPYTINLVSNGLYSLVAEAVTGSGTGLPAIVSGVDLTIVGTGATIQRSTASGTPNFRIFFINNGATLRLNTLAVRNGSFVGVAGVYVGPGFPGGFGGNAFGGAIFNSGTLIVSDSTFANNHAVGGAGGDGGNGSNNSGLPGGAGGAGGDAGSASGGAISNLGTLIATGSTFSDNAALGGIGGNGGNGGNGMGSPGGPGGSAGKGSDATGGALNTGGMMTVTNSTFAGNTATGGAGGNGGNPGMGTGDSIRGLGASGGMGKGGAIADIAGDPLTVTNSTITTNTATGGTSGTGSNGMGASATGSGGGIRTTGGGVTVRNTLLAANTAISDGNCGNFVTDGGYNLEFSPTTTCNFLDHAQSGDPLLGVLANHGGPTQTILLGTGSAAINNGRSMACAGTTGGVDQRGLPRPAGQCSIGAFEPQAPPTLTAMSLTSGPIAGGSSVTLIGTAFLPGATVTFGVKSAITVTVVNPTTITVTTPAQIAGIVSVAVTNPDLQTTPAMPYTYGTVSTSPAARPSGVSLGGSPRPLPGARQPPSASSGGPPSPLPPSR